MSTNYAEPDAGLAIDPEHPWIGLASYTEETRGYFHGRDEEAAELARRVQRKPLTVLFGQSGLGKTSLLRAGLVPRLRDEGFCPVYVRIDYAPESPPPAEQIKQAIFRATADAGHWSRPGAAIEGESLWEFLHHRGDLLRDADGRPLLPLLIFDQFEEIFTLGQSDDAGRLRARQFLEDLADLVENRPPAALEARLEEDEADAEQFDFARADYRILIALREDYLAHLESLKNIMPSVTQNRMRLARMNGVQALTAVLKPGGRLVSQEVAEAIVRFVAGGSEVSNAEVEPSLLSLVCRELNNARIARGAAEISVGLLAGSRDTILTEFYERALADQPAGVRRVIEDELLTESGHRESLAEQRVQKALAAAGAEPDALLKLVNRRLLRIEERLDVRRVELTHDVLCSVVRTSRDLRHEREARDEAQRKLEAQQARGDRHAARAGARPGRGRVSVALMLVAGDQRRVRLGELQSRPHRGCRSATGETDGGSGPQRGGVAGQLPDRGLLHRAGTDWAARDHGQPGASRGGLLRRPARGPGHAATQMNHGLALVREGGALGAQGGPEAADESIDRALALFEPLQSDPAYAAQARFGLGLALFTRHSSGTTIAILAEEDITRAAGLLRPLAYVQDATRQARVVYAELLVYQSWIQRTRDDEASIETCEEARELLAGLGARDLSDLDAASIYAQATDAQARHALAFGRVEEATELSQVVYDMTEQVLAQRPADLRALQNRIQAANTLSSLALRRYDLDAARGYAARVEQAGEELVRFNPSSLASWQSWVNGKQELAWLLAEEGRISAGIEILQSAVALQQDPRAPRTLFAELSGPFILMAELQAWTGQLSDARESFEHGLRAGEAFVEPFPEGGELWRLAQVWPDVQRARQARALGEDTRALEHGQAAAARLRAMDDVALLVRHSFLRGALSYSTDAALRLGRYAEAEAWARERLDVPVRTTAIDPGDLHAETRIGLAHAIAMQERLTEASELLAPELARYRENLEQGARGVRFHQNFAHALYVSAITQPEDEAGQTRRAAALAEAAGLLAGLSAEARGHPQSRALMAWIEAADGTVPSRLAP
jgi:tetratricopeptide (TPR) repeat protein